MARQNFKETLVQVAVAGHFNDAGNPFQFDTTYQVQYERASLDDTLYLYACEYSLTESGGQRTVLSFCRTGTLVADVRAQ
jgi:prophage tail gpP-like protein